MNKVVQFPVDRLEGFPWDMWEKLKERYPWTNFANVVPLMRLESERLGLDLREYIRQLWRKRSLRSEDLRWSLLCALTDRVKSLPRPPDLRVRDSQGRLWEL